MDEYMSIIDTTINSITNIATKCKNSIKNIQIPDRTRIFITSLWFWGYILYFITKIINKCIGLFLVFIPDSCIIINPFTIKNKLFNFKKTQDVEINKPIILDARVKTENNNYESITNKIRTIIDNKWDIDIGNDNCPFGNTEYNDLFGGVNVKDIINIYPTLSSAVLWVSYLFETEKKINNMSDDELGKKIKHMLINFNDRSIHRSSDLKKAEKIIVGEIHF